MFYTGKVCDKHPEADGLRYNSCRKCVPCHNVVAAQNRRNTIKVATPPWANKKAIAKLYRKAKKQGKMVDHIIPLNHPKVCGLHVEANLRVIDKPTNLSKGNKFRVITIKGVTNGRHLQLRSSTGQFQPHVRPSGERHPDRARLEAA